jgi:hypothetical protein
MLHIIEEPALYMLQHEDSEIFTFTPKQLAQSDLRQDQLLSRNVLFALVTTFVLICITGGYFYVHNRSAIQWFFAGKRTALAVTTDMPKVLGTTDHKVVRNTESPTFPLPSVSTLSHVVTDQVASDSPYPGDTSNQPGVSEFQHPTPTPTSTDPGITPWPSMPPDPTNPWSAKAYAQQQQQFKAQQELLIACGEIQTQQVDPLDRQILDITNQIDGVPADVIARSARFEMGAVQRQAMILHEQNILQDKKSALLRQVQGLSYQYPGCHFQ